MGSTLFLAAGMPLVGLSPTGWVLFCVFVAYGLADAVTDVSMNAAGVEAQRRRGRTVLNSMHGIWSVGAVTAGLVASAAAELRVPLAIHLGTVAAVCAVLALLVGRWVPQVSGEAPGAAGLGFTAFTTAMVPGAVGGRQGRGSSRAGMGRADRWPGRRPGVGGGPDGRRDDPGNRRVRASWAWGRLPYSRR